MTVSIITPAYNRANTLPRLFDSLQKQTCMDFEWIVVDDGSVDNTREVVADFENAASFPMRCFTKTNGGVHTARNRGIREATGTLIMFIDSDDALMPHAVELGITLWNKTKFDFLFGRYVREDGKTLGIPYPENFNDLPKFKKDRFRRKYSFDCFVTIQTDILKNNFYPEPENTKFILESMLWNELYVKYECLYTNEIFGTNYHDQENQLTKHWQTPEIFRAYYLASLDLFNRIFDMNKSFTAYEKTKVMYRLLRAGIKLEKPLRKINRDLKKSSSRLLAAVMYVPLYIYISVKKGC